MEKDDNEDRRLLEVFGNVINSYQDPIRKVAIDEQKYYRGQIKINTERFRIACEDINRCDSHMNRLEDQDSVDSEDIEMFKGVRIFHAC